MVAEAGNQKFMVFIPEPPMRKQEQAPVETKVRQDTVLKAAILAACGKEDGGLRTDILRNVTDLESLDSLEAPAKAMGEYPMLGVKFTAETYEGLDILLDVLRARDSIEIYWSDGARYKLCEKGVTSCLYPIVEDFVDHPAAVTRMLARLGIDKNVLFAEHAETVKRVTRDWIAYKGAPILLKEDRRDYQSNLNSILVYS